MANTDNLVDIIFIATNAENGEFYFNQLYFYHVVLTNLNARRGAARLGG